MPVCVRARAHVHASVCMCSGRGLNVLTGGQSMEFKTVRNRLWKDATREGGVGPLRPPHRTPLVIDSGA